MGYLGDKKNLLDNLLEKYGNDFSAMINFHGEEISKFILIEECSELIQSSVKMLRMKNYSDFLKYRASLLEESADVIISLYIYLKAQKIDLKELIEEIDIKMKRNIKRINIE